MACSSFSAILDCVAACHRSSAPLATAIAGCLMGIGLLAVASVSAAAQAPHGDTWPGAVPLLAGPSGSGIGTSGPAAAIAPLGGPHQPMPLAVQEPAAVARPDLSAVPPPALPASPPTSPIEMFYRQRTGDPVAQFGYALFEDAVPAPISAPPLGQIGPDYELGVGDALVVTLLGQTSTTQDAIVDVEGLLVIPGLAPIAAAGRTLGMVRQDVADAVATTFVATQAFVSVAGIRQVSVLVVGTVNTPGRHTLTSLSTPLDALFAAGGVTRLGSLRHVTLVRDGEARMIDLYAVLGSSAAAAETVLRNGDRIVVPSLGPTAAVTGAVPRPSVVELPPATEPPMTVADALALAGGPLGGRPWGDGLLHLTLEVTDDTGAQSVVSVVAPAATPMLPGAILRVAVPRPQPADTLSLSGAVATPGPQPFDAGAGLGDMLSTGAALAADSYLPFAVLMQNTAVPGSTTLTPVDLGAVLDGRSAPLLSGSATLIVLSVDEVRFLSSALVIDRLRGRPLNGAEGVACVGLTMLETRLAAADASPALRAAADRLAAAALPCPDIFKTVPELLPLALDHAVLVEAGVPRPGLYPVAGPVAPAVVLRAAGDTAAAGTVLTTSGDRVVRPGDVVGSEPDLVTLDGAIAAPGSRPLAVSPTLAAALGDRRQFTGDTYPLFGVIERPALDGMRIEVVPFAPESVLAGAVDLPLAAGDRVLLFEATALGGTDSGVGGADGSASMPIGGGAIVSPGAALPDNSGAGDLAAIDLGLAAPQGWPAVAEDASTGISPPLPAPPSPLPTATAGTPAITAAIAQLAADRSVEITGAVLLPGRYPVGGTVTLAALLDAAGGLSRTANPSAIEITTSQTDTNSATLVPSRATYDLAMIDPALISVRAGDRVQVPVFDDPAAGTLVSIAGEVRHPGRYPMLRGERLSDLIARAGGLTEIAYPDGAVFTRASQRALEQQRFRGTADLLDRQLGMALAGPERPSDAEIALTRDLSQQLRSAVAVGRIVVEADPEALALSPEQDIVLQDGDSLFVPARPLTVNVTGEVLAPAALAFDPDANARAYVRLAGGTTQTADEGRTFVVFPDGSAQPVGISHWNVQALLIPPGATIVVPRDAEPFDFLEVATQLSGVLGQIAISAATINALAN